VCGVHVDGRYADLRRLVDLGGAVAVATNVNPGSAPCVSLATAMGFAVRACGLTAAEAWVACTANAAAVLGMTDRGAVAPGLRADLVLWACRDEREVPYWVGGPGVDAVICGGEGPI
jgi:imidazolonepropionase